MQPSRRSPGRAGRPWRTARRRCLARNEPCAWCGNYIDVTIPYPDPYSAAIDHIIELCDGGSPIAQANLQAMHKQCNEAKQAAKQAGVLRMLITSRDW